MLGEFAQWNRFAGTDAIDERKIGTRENAEVLAVLLVNALDVLRYHQLDAGAHLRVGRCLARRSLSPPLAANRTNEAARLDAALGHWHLVAALETQIRKLSQGLVIVVADVRGRYFVCRYVVTKRDVVGPGEVFTGQLALHEVRLLSQEQNAPAEPNGVGALLQRLGS